MEGRTLVYSEDLYTNFYTFEGVVRALNGVSLVVNQGETYGLVGESGCGKSVTVRSIMRIVPAPGRIESGRIVIFFNSADAKNGCEIVGRSEAYMESIRGNDISMIFQEPGAALNPVLSVAEQVGESFQFHRLDQMLEETVRQLAAERAVLPRASPARLWKAFQSAMYTRELTALARFKDRVEQVDVALCAYECREDEEAVERKRALNRRRESYSKKDRLTRFVSRFPFLRRYRCRLSRTIRGHVVELLASLGIPNPANVASRYPHELSGGMQQRVVIAIALACHPTLLIADEPTSNLDVTIQAQIVDLIKTLKKTTISSVLFITHDLGLVAEVCDRVSVMYAGDVDETATVRELFRNPLHPYSRGLLSAVPTVQLAQELSMIPGAVPNLIMPPSGCRFHPRCPSRMEVCAREKPPLVEHSPGHWVACHLYPAEASARG